MFHENNIHVPDLQTQDTYKYSYVSFIFPTNC